MGFRCFLLAYRETGQGAVVMTNGENGNWVVQRAFARIASAYGWPDYPQELAERDVPDDAALAAFSGTYDLRGAPITVSRDGGNLLIAFPGQRPIEFVPHSADSFAGWIDATIRFDLARGRAAPGGVAERRGDRLPADPPLGRVRPRRPLPARRRFCTEIAPHRTRERRRDGP